MAIFPGADTSRMLSGFRTRMAVRGVVLHVAVSESAFPYYSSGLGAHFYIRKDGTVVQQIDTAYKGGHALNGNSSLIGIETQGGVHDPQNEPWTDAQLNSLAAVCRWIRETHGVPLQLMPDSKKSSRGIGWHRQGVDGNFPAGMLAGRVSGGEKWSSSRGKVCPGNIKISQVPVVVQRAGGAPVYNPPTPGPAQITYGSRTIRKGHTGQDVQVLQAKLNAHGYNLTVDGVFGPATHAAVLAFQRAKGLGVDGLVGPNTRAALEGAVAAPNVVQVVVSKTVNNVVHPTGPGLAVDGSFGVLTIRALQTALGVAADGSYGPITKRALQRRVGAAPDGIVGPITIKALQVHLNHRGAGLQADGVWGPLTTKALQKVLNAGAF